ncbi:hypothetical protein KUCAC02_014230, partial [Chaenocephalus aceratus]
VISQDCRIIKQLHSLGHYAVKIIDILLNPNSLTPPPQPPTKTSNQPAPWRPLILPNLTAFTVGPFPPLYALSPSVDE